MCIQLWLLYTIFPNSQQIWTSHKSRALRFIMWAWECHSSLLSTVLCDRFKTLYIYVSMSCAGACKCVGPLPSVGFLHAGAPEPSSPPFWNMSLRHSHGASASWSRVHTLLAVHVQPCPIYGRYRSAWVRVERIECTHRGQGKINPQMGVCCIKLCFWPQNKCESVRVMSSGCLQEQY